MFIKPQRLPDFLSTLLMKYLTWSVRRRFNKMVIHDIKIKQNSSYLLLFNHFSFLDGFLAQYLCRHSAINAKNSNSVFFMLLKKQMEKNPWLKYFGCFSVDPGKGSVLKSMKFATSILKSPNNILVVFPQGNLESIHVQKIALQEGIGNIIQNIKGDCQIIWCSMLVEYFESLKPSLHYHLLDCGTAEDYDPKVFQEKINQFHQASLKQHIRFTKDN